MSSSAWCTERYAVITICLKKIIEDNTIPITDDLYSIFWYSFTSFRETKFETLLNRTVDMIISYKEFHKMVKHMPNKDSTREVMMFIIKSFPSTVPCDYCESNTFTIKDTDKLIYITNTLIKLYDI